MRPRSSSTVRVSYPLTRSEIIGALTRGIDALRQQIDLTEVVLFGSVAASRHTAGSDVDLLIVHRNTTAADVFKLAKTLIPVARLEPHVFSEAEAARMSEVLDRMRRGGVRLFPAG